MAMRYTYRSELIGEVNLRSRLDTYAGADRLVTILPYDGRMFLLVWETPHEEPSPREAHNTPVGGAAVSAAPSPKPDPQYEQRAAAARLLGSAGGSARVKSMTPEERSAVASLGGKATAGKPRVHKRKIKWPPLD